MKKYIYIYIVTILVVQVLFFSSCNKYEEGPKISLLTKKARLTGDWELNSYSLQNNVLIYTHKEEHSRIIIKKDGTGIHNVFYTEITDEAKFNWNFSNKKENLTFEYLNTIHPIIQDYEIVKLTNKELWLKTIINITSENDIPKKDYITFKYKKV